MRKVVLSMNVTLDGFMAGPDCGLDWHFPCWNVEMAQLACDQLKKADTVLLGRITYEAMAAHWPFVVNDTSYPREDLAFAEMMNHHRKIVFSKTLEKAEWNNASLAKENILAEIKALKKMPGKDMIVLGSGSIATALMRHNLIDEYVLWVHPVVIGKGRPLFHHIQQQLYLKLVNTQMFTTGVVIIYYRAVRR